MLAPVEERLDEVTVSEARVVVIRTGGDKLFWGGANIGAFCGLAPSR